MALSHVGDCARMKRRFPCKKIWQGTPYQKIINISIWHEQMRVEFLWRIFCVLYHRGIAGNDKAYAPGRKRGRRTCSKPARIEVGCSDANLNFLHLCQGLRSESDVVSCTPSVTTILNRHPEAKLKLRIGSGRFHHNTSNEMNAVHSTKFNIRKKDRKIWPPICLLYYKCLQKTIAACRLCHVPPSLLYTTRNHTILPADSSNDDINGALLNAVRFSRFRTAGVPCIGTARVFFNLVFFFVRRETARAAALFFLLLPRMTWSLSAQF